MTAAELEMRARRLAAGIAQSGMTESGTVVTAWQKTAGMHEVTVHVPGTERVKIFETPDGKEAIMHVEREIARLEGVLPEN